MIYHGALSKGSKVNLWGGGGGGGGGQLPPSVYGPGPWVDGQVVCI